MRGRTYRLVGGVALWVVGVASVAAVAWFAIDSAGRQVGVDTVYIANAAAGTPGGATPRPAETTSPSALGTATSTTAASTASSNTQPHVAETTGGPESTSSSTSGTPRSGHTPASSRWPTSAPPWTGGPTIPNPLSSSIATPGGSVYAQCSANAIIDYAAQPGNGWRGSVTRSSPGELEVAFKRSPREITVQVTCSSGRPNFVVDSHSGDE